MYKAIWLKSTHGFICRIDPYTSLLLHYIRITPQLYSQFSAICLTASSSCLVRSSAYRAAWVLALAGDIVLCSWTRLFTLTVPLSTQVYKLAPTNLMLGVPSPAVN